jgi:hypothetical protein
MVARDHAHQEILTCQEQAASLTIENVAGPVTAEPAPPDPVCPPTSTMVWDTPLDMTSSLKPACALLEHWKRQSIRCSLRVNI